MVESAQNPYYVLGLNDDVGILKIEPFTNMSSYEGGEHTISAYVGNFGKNSQGSFDVRLNITKRNGSTSTLVYSNTTTVGEQLNQNQTAILSWNYNFNEVGTYTIKLETLKADGYGANNKKEITITITSAGSEDTTPPSISNVAVSSITANSATITWSTDEASTSAVEYGTTTEYGQTATGSNGVTTHSVILSGLTASTTYHFRVKSADAAGNTAVSSDYTFTTLANSSDVIVLRDGVAATGSLSGAKDAKHYMLDVGSGRALLKIELTGPSGTDFDLYAKLGAKPTTSTYDYRSISTTSTETINVTSPATGSWYFMVYSYSGSGTFTIKATTTAGTTNITQLSDGVPHTDTLSGTGKGKNYSVSVPAGKKQLKIEMVGPGNADFDIYVKFGMLATRTTYDYKSTSSSSNESIAIADPGNGIWYILVYSYSGSGNFTLKATMYDSATQEFAALLSGEAKNGTIDTAGQKVYFHIVVPSGISALTIELVGPASADFDLYVRLNSNPSTSAYDYRAVRSGSQETIQINGVPAGTWYIMVYAYAGYGTFTIKATITP
ncbi:MAG: pre-peptidase C-terminal domain-containing protein [Thermoplasmata archaeon]